MRWFTSDLHLGHARIIELCNRPFSNVDEMNRVLIEDINKSVKPDDTLYILGDVAMGTLDDTLPLIERIQCDVVIIAGNHDRCHPSNGVEKAERNRERYTGLRNVIRVANEEWTGIAGRSVKLSHFPYYGDPYSRPNLVPFYPVDDGSWLLHGHVHTEWRTKDRMLNVGVDRNLYRPVSETQVERWMDSYDA